VSNEKSGWIRKRIGDAGLDTVIVAFVDHNGRLMGKRLAARYFLDEFGEGGVHVCNYLLAADVELEPLPGFALTGWDKGYSDFHLVPDPETFRVLPWFDRTGLVIADVFNTDGTMVEVSPRRILQRRIEALGALGLRAETASELEFYLFRGTYDEISDLSRLPQVTTPYIVDYDILGTSRDEDVLADVRRSMRVAGVEVEGSKGEWGRGQHEINLAHCGPLKMTDWHVVFKQGVKVIAGRHGRAATFMAKVDAQMAGSSCHIHVSLKDDQGNNPFWNGGPSKLFYNFLGGYLKYLKELTLLLAPTINSYKRFSSRSFAPTTLAWGWDNRTCGIRAVGKGPSLRLECRLPGADANPYLALSALLAAGAAGIEEDLDAPKAVQGNAYEQEGLERVPGSLEEAARLWRGSKLAHRVFGDGVVEHYAHLAELEVAAMAGHVTDWERRRYFERM